MEEPYTLIKSYKLKFVREQTISVPRYSEILSIIQSEGEPLLNLAYISEDKDISEEMTIFMFNSNSPIKIYNMSYITTLVNDLTFCEWHIFVKDKI